MNNRISLEFQRLERHSLFLVDWSGAVRANVRPVMVGVLMPSSARLKQADLHRITGARYARGWNTNSPRKKSSSARRSMSSAMISMTAMARRCRIALAAGFQQGGGALRS